MGIGALDYKKGGSGLNINGIIEDYYVYAGENVNAGDFVEFINGIAGKSTGTSEDTSTGTGNLNTSIYIKAIELDEKRVLVSYKKSDYLYGVVCSISGVSITIGTHTKLSDNAYSGYCLAPVLIAKDKVFIAHTCTSSYSLYGIVCTINGTTITAGTDTSFGITVKYDSSTGVSAALLSEDKVFITYSYGSSTYLYGTVCTITDTTPAIGSKVKLNTSSGIGKYHSTITLPNGNVFLACGNGTMRGIVCTISGTTITAGTHTALTSTTNSCTGNISTVLLENSNVFVAYCSGSSSQYYLHGIVCSISGTTVAGGTITELSPATYSGDKLSATALYGNKVFIAHGRSSSYKLYGVVCSISGLSITTGADTSLGVSIYDGGEPGISAVRLNNGTVFLAHTVSDTRAMFAQIWGIDEENNIPTNEVTVAEYETQVRPATTLPCKGVAKSSGEGGDETAHNEQVSIYVPELGVK